MGTDNSNHVSRRDCRRRGADRPGGDCRPSARRRQEAKAQGRQEGQEGPQGPKGRQEGPKEPQGRQEEPKVSTKVQEGRQEGQKVQEEDDQATATTCRTRRQQARPRRPNHRPVRCCRYEGCEGTHQRCCYSEGSRQEGHQGCQFCFEQGSCSSGPTTCHQVCQGRQEGTKGQEIQEVQEEPKVPQVSSSRPALIDKLEKLTTCLTAAHACTVA